MSDSSPIGRRSAMGAIAGAVAGAGLGCGSDEARRASAPTAPVPEQPAGLRTLGRTGATVAPISLGGEGVLRQRGDNPAAVATIEAALEAGVRYCDTAPAYRDSQDYYGAAFRNAGTTVRDGVFLASKTHARDRDGSLSLLDESLRRMGTDRLDLWQLHDVRDEDTLDRIFGPGGAIEAMTAARDDGRVRHLGITGHADPAILVEALRRFDFDSVLVPINPSDPARRPFVSTVVAEARQRGVAVVGMKVFAKGRITAAGVASPEECLRYSAALADTCIVGCDDARQARENLELGERIVPMNATQRAALERRFTAHAGRFDYYKAS